MPTWHYERRAQRQGHALVAGVDEAGRGSWAGPVVAAAAIVRSRRFYCRIDDSKRLTPKARQAAFYEILSHADVGVGIIGPAIIDQANIYQANLEAMRQAVSRLPRRPAYLLVDGTLPRLGEWEQLSVVDGDQKSFSIACASIVAKVVRDQLMRFYDAFLPGYGFAAHKGYGTEQHRLALERLGPAIIHRHSFEPVRIVYENSR